MNVSREVYSVPKNLIFTDKEAAFLRELVKEKVRFMIVGLSAATLQGAAVVTQDIDLWFENLASPKLRKVLKKMGASYVPPSVQNPPLFAGENLKMFDIVVNMDGLKRFAQEWKHTIEVPLGGFKVRVLSLERIIESKKAANRKKDRLTMPILQDALLAVQKHRTSKKE